MKLLTHNMMTSKCIRGVNVGFPLGIVVKETKEVSVDFNPEFVCRMLPKLDWDALYQAAQTLGCAEGIPKALASNYEQDQEFLKRVHHILFEVEIVAGELVCPETGRKFPITNGIPNMLLNEDEV